MSQQDCVQISNMAQSTQALMLQRSSDAAVNPRSDSKGQRSLSVAKSAVVSCMIINWQIRDKASLTIYQNPERWGACVGFVLQQESWG